MDGRSREVRYKVSYKVVVTDNILDDPIIKTTSQRPLVSSVGNLTQVDFLDGQVIFSSSITWIQIDEVKVRE